MTEPQEFVFETVPPQSPDVFERTEVDLRVLEAARSLRQLAGVLEAHVDPHGTWALATMDPRITRVSTVIGCLAAHGFRVSRMRTLSDPPEPPS